MRFPILVRWHLYIESGPWCMYLSQYSVAWYCIQHCNDWSRRQIRHEGCHITCNICGVFVGILEINDCPVSFCIFVATLQTWECFLMSKIGCLGLKFPDTLIWYTFCYLYKQLYVVDLLNYCINISFIWQLLQSLLSLPQQCIVKDTGWLYDGCKIIIQLFANNVIWWLYDGQIYIQSLQLTQLLKQKWPTSYG